MVSSGSSFFVNARSLIVHRVVACGDSNKLDQPEIGPLIGESFR
jgi:hypothetical protein